MEVPKSPILDPPKTTKLIEDPCRDCNAESTIGAHGIRNDEIYDEYYCEACWRSK